MDCSLSTMVVDKERLNSFDDIRAAAERSVYCNCANVAMVPVE